MNRLVHARLARMLIDACGGGLAAAAVCRVGNSQLSDYCQPHGEGFMPADVIADLEAYCGQPLYSRAIAEAQPGAEALRALIDEACEATEAATALQKAVRQAAAAGAGLTLAQRQALGRIFEVARNELAHVGVLIDGDPA